MFPSPYLNIYSVLLPFPSFPFPPLHLPSFVLSIPFPYPYSLTPLLLLSNRRNQHLDLALLDILLQCLEPAGGFVTALPRRTAAVKDVVHLLQREAFGFVR